jgi:hypothetical protein
LTRVFFAKRLGLLRHGALHGFGDFDVLHLHALDLDAPRFGHSIDRDLQRP